MDARTCSLFLEPNLILSLTCLQHKSIFPPSLLIQSRNINAFQLKFPPLLPSILLLGKSEGISDTIEVKVCGICLGGYSFNLSLDTLEVLPILRSSEAVDDIYEHGLLRLDVHLPEGLLLDFG